MKASSSFSRTARKSRVRLTLSAVVVAVVAPLAITAAGPSGQPTASASGRSYPFRTMR